MTTHPIRRALLSVSDKTGLVAFAQALAARGIELISTGGTAGALRAAGLAVTSIDGVTGFPEILDGRVKTLHPKVHGGLLGLRDNPAHAAQMREHGITPIDLVCVNLYPFEQTIARPDCTHEEAIENIDIGGPSMIRSAAKNHAYATVVTCPAQYERVLADLALHQGATSPALRAELAREAFALTSHYDAAIAAHLGQRSETHFPPLLSLMFVKAEDLRYGENPHQDAALYRRVGRGTGGSIARAEQLHGKELSYNNINDAQAALSLAQTLARVDESTVGACIVKHTNPCGAALGSTARDAIDQAIAGDPVAAYGGILAINAPFDADAAERLRSKEVFLEVIVAPSFDADALETLRARWANVRLLAVGEVEPDPAQPELRSIPDGLLAQDRDVRLATHEELVLRAGPEPGPEARRLASFLEAVAKFLFSNAVCLGGTGEAGCIRLFGAGAGQMDRVTSCRLACEKAAKFARGAVAFSDAFFPFPDGPEILIEAGVTTIVHPGGSKRDQETFDLCAKRGVACLTTGLRHFRH
ncbi:phosphoribosylaminoimidazolecarboxamide formyltransferase / IMP cyclohydrolase [Phycisphaerales bacterium]|nr:phosphoribosylaminoimidazolecarboxamide formyltransferase / IMP cyclohydrolase [Phycisphaerales bacterium]